MLTQPFGSFQEAFVREPSKTVRLQLGLLRRPIIEVFFHLQPEVEVKFGLGPQGPQLTRRIWLTGSGDDEAEARRDGRLETFTACGSEREASSNAFRLRNGLVTA